MKKNPCVRIKLLALCGMMACLLAGCQTTKGPDASAYEVVDGVFGSDGDSVLLRVLPTEHGSIGLYGGNVIEKHAQYGIITYTASGAGGALAPVSFYETGAETRLADLAASETVVAWWEGMTLSTDESGMSEVLFSLKAIPWDGQGGFGGEEVAKFSTYR